MKKRLQALDKWKAFRRLDQARKRRAMGLRILSETHREHRDDVFFDRRWRSVVLRNPMKALRTMGDHKLRIAQMQGKRTIDSVMYYRPVKTRP